MKTSSPEQPKPSSPLKILIMGPPGSRKTTLLLQFPDVHVLDCDNNLDGPERHLRNVAKLPLSYTFDSIRFKEDGSQEEVFLCFQRVCDKLRLFRTDAAYKARKVVAVDSLSHVNEFIIRYVLKIQGSDRRIPGNMEARDWGPFKSCAYELLVARLEETAKTVICTCHEIKLTESDPANIMSQRVIGYEPFFQGKVGDTIGAFFTDVWRTEIRQGPGGVQELWLRSSPSPKFEILKNSVGLPAELNLKEGFKTLAPYLQGRI